MSNDLKLTVTSPDGRPMDVPIHGLDGPFSILEAPPARGRERIFAERIHTERPPALTMVIYSDLYPNIPMGEIHMDERGAKSMRDMLNELFPPTKDGDG